MPAGTGESDLCPRPGYKHWSTVVLSLPSRGDMIMTASGGVQGKVSDVKECAGCNKKIHDKFVLKVGSTYWCSGLFSHSNTAGHGSLLARGLSEVRLL